ncbi:MAG: 3-methyl-2-oxobutanoate hydroxymethyltransferase [Candidatus Omnitrophica bacterium]|nr:3-methyl-2-oxobutanoate hydroxymethyltransferase [Candidatus Omnitrophota bacterium]
MAQITIADLQDRKRRGEPITMLTAYDCPMAALLDRAGIDVVLVGDSLGMVVLGYETTTPVTMEEMLHHAKAARRGVARALLVGDMPFLSFRGSVAEAVKNAGRFIQEAGCEAVKVEWKPGIEDAAKAIVDAGIPVMGHVGLTPQTAAAEGGFGMRGMDAESASRIVAQAVSLQDVGCFAMVLECIPDVVAQEITGRLTIPTIGIGSGPHCDGQVVVTYDLLGLFDRFTPKFVKRYANLSEAIREAATAYIRDVKAGAFPGPSHTRTMPPEEFRKLQSELES